MTQLQNKPEALFICGCPRSGTSAVADWLSQTEEFAIGMERYQKYWREHLTFPDNALTASRFFDIQKGDAWYDSLDQFPVHYQRLRKKWDTASFVGDKIPRLWEDFASLFRQFPDARVVYTFRDPFAVARSYKQRSLNPDDDLNWGSHRDASYGIQEWNDSAQRLADFFNSDTASGNHHDRCYVLRYEEFVANSMDRRTLSAFLNKQIDFGIVKAADVPNRHDKADLFTDIETELLWTLLDTRLLEEVGKIIEAQTVHLLQKATASSKPGRRDWYHTCDRRDAGMDYGEFRIPGCNYVFRGLTKSLDTTKPYAAVIGSATTFGRFLKRPYPSQLEDAAGMPFINLGIGGARPEIYLGNKALMDFLRGASLVIVEMMSARGYPSPFFSPAEEAGNMGLFMDAFGLASHAHEDKRLEWLLLQSAEKKHVFIDRAYEITFQYLTHVQREVIRDAVVSRYLKDFRQLVSEIGKPVVALLMTRNQPYQVRKIREPENLLQWTGDYPHFIDGVAVQFVRQQGVPVVESRSQRGLPYVVRNWVTGEPAPVYSWQADPSLNTYYPSQEMHDDAVLALMQEPMIKSLCDKNIF